MPAASKASILLVTNDFGPRAGGIETFIIGLLTHIQQNPQRLREPVIVYTSAQSESEEYDAWWLNHHGVTVIRDRRKILLPTPRVYRTLKKIIRHHEISIVWFGAAAPLGIMSRALRSAGARRIVALTHGHEVWWAKIPPFKFAIRFIARHVDQLGYLGEFTRSAITPALRMSDRNKLIKIAPGIDSAHFRPTERDPKLIEKYSLTNKHTIISVGRLVHRKGQDRLIEALPQVLAQFPNAVLIFVGIGPRMSYLQKLVSEKKLEDSVRFIGRISHDELPRYFALGDIFAMPARSRLAGLEVEGLGIVYLEASACGLPVIAGKSGGAPDAVLEGKSGIIVDGHNIHQIANGITTLLANEDQRNSMGSFGRQWVISEWSWEHWTSEFTRALGIN